MPDDWHDRWIAGELTPVELSDLHAMFAAYVERVTVSRALKRGSVFDPERVAVTWRST